MTDFDRLKSDGDSWTRDEPEARAVAGEELWLPPSTLAGITVTPDSALTLVASFAAINVLATDSASLDFRVKKTQPDGSKVLDPSHPVDELIHWSPDGVRTAMNFRQSHLGHTLGYGNGYGYVKRKGNGRPYALDLLDPATTKPKRIDGRVVYELAGQGINLPAADVLHVAGLGYDGLIGYSPVKMARQAIALGLAAEAFGATFFGNGAHASGHFKYPTKLKPEAKKNIRETWQDIHQGPYNAHKLAILEEGLEWVKNSVDPEDAQFLLTRAFQVLEICRLYRVPPHKLMDYSQAHLANLEESNTDYLVTSLMPWLVIVERQYTLKLFTRAERAQGYHVEHDMSTLLRGNMAARAAFYKQMFMMGILSVDEIRQREGWNPIGEAAGGSKRFVQMQLVTLDKAGDPAAAKPAIPTPGDDGVDKEQDA